MRLATVYVLGTKTDEREIEEVRRVVEGSQGKQCQVKPVIWPLGTLPWLTEQSGYAIVLIVTRASIDREAGWTQAISSRHIDGSLTIALFLAGIRPATTAELTLYSAHQLIAKTVADASHDLAKCLSLVCAPAQPKARGTHALPDAGFLVGREEDIRLGLQLSAKPAKSIAVVGLGGQGKTTYAVALAERLAPTFGDVVWIPLRNAPTLDWLAQQLAMAVGAEISEADATAETATRNILRVLSGHSVLLVLDNAEAVFGRRHFGPHPDVLEDLASHYELFFRALAETSHNSLVLVTSRELPNAYRLFPEVLRVLRLPGLSDSAVATLMQQRGVSLPAERVRVIQSRLRGNPYALKLLCGLYLDQRGTDPSELLSTESDLAVDISSLVDEHVSRLSVNERLLLAKIAWEGGRVGSAKLLDLAWPLNGQDLHAGLRRLSRFLLVDVDSGSVAISHPLLHEYLNDDIRRQVRDALLIRTDSLLPLPAVLINVLLVNTLADDSIQALQVAAVDELASEVSRQLGTRARLRARLQKLVAQARGETQIGYIVANAFEMARRGGVSLRGLDLSELPLDRVDFRNLDVREVDCTGAAFRSCVFEDSFGPVTAAATVGDMGLAAAATFEGHIRLWTQTGDLHTVVKCADDWISAITVPDKGGTSYFAAVDGQLGAITWLTQTVRTLTTLRTQVRGLAKVSSSLVAACTNGSLHLVSLIDSTAIGSIRVGDFRLKVVRAVPGSGDKMVVVGGDSGELYFVDIVNRSITAQLKNGGAWIRDVVFDTLGEMMFIADDDGKVRSWQRSPAGAKPYRHIAEASHSHRVWCLALDEEGGRLYSAGTDSVIRVWDAKTMNQLDLYEGHGSWVRAMALMDSGRVLVSGGEDQTLRFWDTLAGTCRRRRTGYARRVFSVAFADDQILVCGTGDHRVVRFDLSCEPVQAVNFDRHHDQVFAVCADRPTSRIASASDDGELRISDVGTGETVYAERLHTGWIGAVAFSPSGRIVASGADDRRIAVLDAVTFTLVCKRQTHDGRISSIVFIDEDNLVCSSEDGTVRVIRLPSLDERLCVQVGAGSLYAAALLPRQRPDEEAFVVTAGVGGKVFRVGLSDPPLISCMAEFDVNAIWSLDVNSLTGLVAAGLDDGSVALIDASGAGGHTILAAHRRQVWNVRWSPTGDVLASASEEGDIALWGRDGSFQRRLNAPLLYAGFKLAKSEGLTPAERHQLLSLGAIL